MNDDLLIARLRDLPPELPAPGDRMVRVRERLVRRRRVAVVASTLAVALLAGGVVAGAASRRDRAVTPAVAPSCPAQPPVDSRFKDVVVPAAPGVETGGHLVPRETPLRAVVCKYAKHLGDPANPTWALQAAELTGGLDRLAEDLWWFPRALDATWTPMCSGRARRNPVDYLVGLQYPGGTVWVATAGVDECETTTNGAFVSGRMAGDQVDRSRAAGTWLPSRADVSGGSWPKDPCLTTGAQPGRFGQDVALVPPAPVELLVCERVRKPGASGETYRTGTLRDGVAEFAAQLGSGRTLTSDGGCQSSRGVTHHYTLVFRYTDGPPVRISAFIGCDPPLVGDTLGAWEAPGTNLVARLASIVAGG
jgi:hypothetical protein